MLASVPVRERTTQTAGRQAADVNTNQIHHQQAPYSTTRPTRDRNTHIARRQAAERTVLPLPPAALHSTTRPTGDRSKQVARKQAADVHKVLQVLACEMRCAAYLPRGGAAYLPRGGSPLEPRYQFLISSEVITPSRRSCIRSSNSAARSATMLSSKAKSIK